MENSQQLQWFLQSYINNFRKNNDWFGEQKKHTRIARVEGEFTYLIYTHVHTKDYKEINRPKH